MSTTTSNFGLFKYDTSTDGQLAFNINQALNYNWDIIDENLGSASIATYDSPGIVKPDGQSIYVDDDGLLSMGNHGFIISSSHIGTTWYRQYSDGFKMCGGQVATSASEVAWAQPTLSSAGTMGGNSFAITSSGEHAVSYAAWKAFDNADSTFWMAAAVTPYFLEWYNPVAIKISTLTVRNFPSHNQRSITGGTIQGSSNGSNWTSLKTFTNSTTGAKAEWTISVDSTSYYKYYKMSISSVSTSNPPAVSELRITATQQSGSGSNIIFPISFSDTNYSFQLGFQGGSGSSTYVSTKSTTGMTLSSTPSGTCSYVCMGW